MLLQIQVRGLLLHQATGNPRVRLSNTKQVMDTEFRKRVAITMLPIIWGETQETGGLVSTKARVVAEQVAELAELMDNKINKKS